MKLCLSYKGEMNVQIRLRYLYDSPNSFWIHETGYRAPDELSRLKFALILKPNRRLGMLGQYLLKVNYNLRSVP
jgi:hypothetical protein